MSLRTQICSLFAGLRFNVEVANETITLIHIYESSDIVESVYQRMYILLSTMAYIHVYRDNNTISVVDVRGYDYSWIYEILTSCA